jgi:hypothetical protein
MKQIITSICTIFILSAGVFAQSSMAIIDGKKEAVVTEKQAILEFKVNQVANDNALNNVLEIFKSSTGVIDAKALEVGKEGATFIVTLTLESTYANFKNMLLAAKINQIKFENLDGYGIIKTDDFVEVAKEITAAHNRK